MQWERKERKETVSYEHEGDVVKTEGRRGPVAGLNNLGPRLYRKA